MRNVDFKDVCDVFIMYSFNSIRLYIPDGSVDPQLLSHHVLSIGPQSCLQARSVRPFRRT